MAKTSKKRRDDDDAVEAPPKPKSDAYVGLLGIAFLALVTGCILMYLDHDELAAQTVPVPAVASTDDGLGTPAKTAAPKN